MELTENTPTTILNHC